MGGGVLCRAQVMVICKTVYIHGVLRGKGCVVARVLVLFPWGVLERMVCCAVLEGEGEVVGRSEKLWGGEVRGYRAKTIWPGYSDL